MTETLFTKIRDRQMDAEFVYEDDDIMAIRDINPQAPVHVLVIPKEPIASVNELQADHAALMGRLVLTAHYIAQQEGIADDGYRLVLNTNAGAGQTVFHLHLHLLGGRPMAWPPG